MEHRIVVAGATGNLGQRIVSALRAHDATVVALVREGTDAAKVAELEAAGATVAAVDFTDAHAIAAACREAECLVSAVAGLREAILDTQTMLLEGALLGSVRRFIPSDFSTDFTTLTPGENRNFDLRREFHRVLDVAPIAATAIFNGAFAEILNYGIPVFDRKKKTVGYWGDPNHVLDFTTMDDTAAYTAAAALDTSAPRALHIASFRVSANDLVRFSAETMASPFALVRLGSVEELRAQNLAARAADPEGEHQLYSRWQQSQYVQSMFSTNHASLDNERYDGVTWTPLARALAPRS